MELFFFRYKMQQFHTSFLWPVRISYISCTRVSILRLESSLAKKKKKKYEEDRKSSMTEARRPPMEQRDIVLDFIRPAFKFNPSAVESI